jgi:Zn-dependent M28 family amino/carboxypeptidase
MALVCASAGCGHGQPAAASANGAAAAQVQPPQAPPASQTGGFDGNRAYELDKELVAFGPRPAGSDANARQQAFLIAQLKSSGCPVTEDDFHASTPAGNLAMKNIIVKLPGTRPDIVIYATHYDTKLLPNFVGADDGASSTALMLELARSLCAQKNALTVWIAFFDGEEAVQDWSDTDSTYGSRELAAELALAGDLGKVKAMVLADMIGISNLQIPRDTNSTSWLTDVVWSTAQRLGYGNVFLNSTTSVEDDHTPFLRRGIPSCDVIDLEDTAQRGIWHTTEDSLDKIDPRSIALVGHVFIESLPALEQKIH